MDILVDIAAWQRGAIGGLLIGLSATLMLLLNGRIAGISGIVGGLVLDKATSDRAWRALFVLGLVAGAALTAFRHPEWMPREMPVPSWLFLIGGLVVGYGTRLGSGCTSGHGVCGIGRLSPRSLAATATFMATGFITVFVVRHLFGVGA